MIDPSLGTLLLAAKSGRQVDRISSGLELQALFESVDVADNELVSDAERAWGYSDLRHLAVSSGDHHGDP